MKLQQFVRCRTIQQNATEAYGIAGVVTFAIGDAQVLLHVAVPGTATHDVLREITGGTLWIDSRRFLEVGLAEQIAAPFPNVAGHVEKVEGIGVEPADRSGLLPFVISSRA